MCNKQTAAPISATRDNAAFMHPSNFLPCMLNVLQRPHATDHTQLHHCLLPRCTWKCCCICQMQPYVVLPLAKCFAAADLKQNSHRSAPTQRLSRSHDTQLYYNCSRVIHCLMQPSPPTSINCNNCSTCRITKAQPNWHDATLEAAAEAVLEGFSTASAESAAGCPGSAAPGTGHLPCTVTLPPSRTGLHCLPAAAPV